MSGKYRNITISGLPGTGSTTLLEKLVERMPDWEGFSGGTFMRAYALEKKLFKPKSGEHHKATDYEDEFDRKVDFGMREALETKEKQALESWLSGFMAQKVDGVLKILLTCEGSLRIDRVVNRDNISVEDAKKHLFVRETQNRSKWERMYAEQWYEWVVGAGTMPETEKIDFWDPRLYDLVIDTYKNSKE